jgi:hypothetical protein
LREIKKIDFRIHPSLGPLQSICLYYIIYYILFHRNIRNCLWQQHHRAGLLMAGPCICLHMQCLLYIYMISMDIHYTCCKCFLTLYTCPWRWNFTGHCIELRAALNKIYSIIISAIRWPFGYLWQPATCLTIGLSKQQKIAKFTH